MITDYDTLPDAIKKYVPDYEYPLFDLLDYSVDEMKGSVRLRIMSIAFEHVFQREMTNLSGRDVILSRLTQGRFLCETNNTRATT